MQNQKIFFDLCLYMNSMNVCMYERGPNGGGEVGFDGEHCACFDSSLEL